MLDRYQYFPDEISQSRTEFDNVIICIEYECTFVVAAIFDSSCDLLVSISGKGCSGCCDNME
jgi:hypothetical protein